MLPDGFHRIRHYGLLASSRRKANIARIRAIIGVETLTDKAEDEEEAASLTLREACPDCGGQMRIIETFRRGQRPATRAPPGKAAA